MNKNMLAAVLASMLVGGVAVAAYNSFRSDEPAAPALTAAPPVAGAQTIDAARSDALDTPRVDYADVVDVRPIRETRPLYASVIDSEPIRETSTTSTPREVCEDVVVQDRLPERDGNVGGTVAGAIIGGLVGNQIGDGNGRKAATAAGAVAGGYIGNRVDRRHVGGRVVARTERQCRTITDTSSATRVVGYNVTYRNDDGTTGTMRMDSKPGNRISLGKREDVVGYDVTYRYQGLQQTVRMDEHPGARLPVVDGEVVLQTAAMASHDTRR
ncbi:MAG TPA: glycine zipper 2TM domain-containing protein [Lysobacter sp.]|nr:glycine zipper 2TM domain-containing protein [Lysobacter sp.]